MVFKSILTFTKTCGTLLCYFLFEFHPVKTKMTLRASVSSEYRVLNKVKLLSDS